MKRLVFFVVLVGSLCSVSLAFSILIPALGSIYYDLQLSMPQLWGLIGWMPLSIAITLIIGFKYFNRFSPQKLLFWGLMALLLTQLVCLFIMQIWFLIFLRVLQGSASAIVLHGILRLMTVDHKNGVYLSVMLGIFLGLMLGFFLGGLVAQRWGWKWNVLVSVVFTGLLALLGKSLKTRVISSSSNSFSSLFTRPFLAVGLISILLMSIVASLLVLGSLLMFQVLHVSNYGVGAYFLTLFIPAVIVSCLVYYIYPYFGMRYCMMFASFLFALACYFQTELGIFLPMNTLMIGLLLIGIAWGILQGACQHMISIAGGSSETQYQGLLICQWIGMSIGCLIIGLGFYYSQMSFFDMHMKEYDMELSIIQKQNLSSLLAYPDQFFKSLSNYSVSTKKTLFNLFRMSYIMGYEKLFGALFWGALLSLVISALGFKRHRLDQKIE